MTAAQTTLPHELGLTLVQLEATWRELGLDPTHFHSLQALLPVLANLSGSRSGELLAALQQLLRDAEACRDVELALRRGLLQCRRPAVIGPLLQKLRPVLRVQPLELLMEHGLSLRTYNSLRRNHIQSLAHLVDLDEHRLGLLPEIGPTAVRELQQSLQAYGLPLPFSRTALEQCCTAASIPSAAPSADPLLEQRWCDQVLHRLQSAGTLIQPLRLLQELHALSVEHYSALPQRQWELHQLAQLVRMMRELAIEDPRGAGLVEGLEQCVLRGYGEQIQRGANARRWLRSQQRRLTLEPGGLAALQRLHQALGGRSADLHALHGQLRRERKRTAVAQLLQQMIARQGRLPHRDESLALLAALTPEQARLLAPLSKLSLARRLALYGEHGVPVPAAEWDLHFRVLDAGMERPGPGYWQSIEPLRQFLQRYAMRLGRPGQMPHQQMLPGSVIHAVQEHGGHGAVARKLGLVYVGQVVGEHGRTYWTQDRLERLLACTVAHHGLAADAMPNRAQILAYMAITELDEFKGQKANSAVAALKRLGRCDWGVVAGMFKRRV